MRKVNVLNIQRLSPAERTKIEAVDPAIQLTDAGGWFDGEYRETWPAYTAARYLRPGANGSGTREERDRLLADAEVVLGGWPFPLDLRARSPHLKWFHQRPAGASNLLRGDLWGSDVIVTTSRGVGLDVYLGEFEHLPPPLLWSDPRVLITPHVSGASDEDRHGGIDLFCENLRAYLDGRPLRNVIDWERGY